MTDLHRRDDVGVLLSHAEDLCVRAAKGTFCHTSFLSPGQCRDVTELLQRTGHMHRARFWGGFAQAERCCLLLFPDYAIDLAADGGEDATVAELLSFCGEQDPVSVLQVTGSGFCKLSHRDYLGSLLSLGLEREVLGDIVLADEQRAYVFCRAAMAAYITEALERVGGDRVNVRAVTLDATFEPQRKVQPIHDTVASARLDCVVASLINCSREVAQTVIRDGRVELDFRVEQRVDHAIATPATISVRGVGKFRVLSVATQTKKGRYRLSAEKYV